MSVNEQEEYEKRSWKYSIKDSQGKNGIISLDTYVHFDEDDKGAIDRMSTFILELRATTEEKYRAKGYKLATDLNKDKEGTEFSQLKEVKKILDDDKDVLKEENPKKKDVIKKSNEFSSGY